MRGVGPFQTIICRLRWGQIKLAFLEVRTRRRKRPAASLPPGASSATGLFATKPSPLSLSGARRPAKENSNSQAEP